MKNKFLTIAIALILAGSAYSSTASAEWKFGIGTGISRLNVEGDISVESAFGGPIDLDIDLDPDDIDDLIDTAFGFGGYATDGTWLITYAYGSLTLKGDETVGPISADIEFETTTIEVLVGYPLLRRDKFSMNVLGGVRNLAHDLDTEFSDGVTTLKNSRDDDWTDLVLGVTADLRLNERWTWANQFDIGNGDSEGNSTIKTALNWQFGEQWSASFFAKKASIEVETGDEGDSDYYKYDNDETTVGASFLYHM
jgi:hypothetical protein